MALAFVISHGAIPRKLVSPAISRVFRASEDLEARKRRLSIANEDEMRISSGENDSRTIFSDDGDNSE